jgi:hypothetical protein
VAREGTKKTVFTNFTELCKAMNRNHEHVSAYLLAELGTSGSLDGQQRLVIKGRFLPKAFETVLRRYVNEWVACFVGGGGDMGEVSAGSSAWRLLGGGTSSRWTSWWRGWSQHNHATHCDQYLPSHTLWCETGGVGGAGLQHTVSIPH